MRGVLHFQSRNVEKIMEAAFGRCGVCSRRPKQVSWPAHEQLVSRCLFKFALLFTSAFHGD